MMRSAISAASMLLVTAGPAAATWSIVAVDRQTREVGIAAASCFPNVDQTGGLLAGVGAVVSQGIINQEAGDEALRLLGTGMSARLALRRIANEKFDPQPLLSWWSGLQVRQYAIVALDAESEPAAFTGARTWGWRGSSQAPGISVQGNMLRGSEVVSQALERFLQSSQCSLADPLVVALEAGANSGGDRRCTPERSALSAYLEVVSPDDSRLRFVAPYDGDVSNIRSFLGFVWPYDGTVEDNAVGVLVRQYVQWRRSAGLPRACSFLATSSARPPDEPLKLPAAGFSLAVDGRHRRLSSSDSAAGSRTPSR